MNFKILKALILCSGVLVAGAAYAQQPKSTGFKVEDGLFLYEKIEPVELSKKEIIAHSAAFLAEKFKSSKSVIELRDDELGKIVGDVILRNPKAKFLSAFPAVKVRIIIDAKDGRYRLQATNIVGVDGNGKVTTWTIEGTNQYRLEPAALEALNAFAAEFKTYISNVKSSSDW